MDYSLPGSSVHGISQARILVFISFRGTSTSFLTQGSNPCQNSCIGRRVFCVVFFFLPLSHWRHYILLKQNRTRCWRRRGCGSNPSPTLWCYVSFSIFQIKNKGLRPYYFYLFNRAWRKTLPALAWCTECVWQAGWPWTSHASLLSLISSYVKWGNARDSELFSFLPILGHLPSVICFPVRLFTASLQRVSATQVLHHWGLLTWALGTGAWDRTTMGIGWAWKPWFWSLWSGGGW